MYCYFGSVLPAGGTVLVCHESRYFLLTHVVTHILQCKHEQIGIFAHTPIKNFLIPDTNSRSCITSPSLALSSGAELSVDQWDRIQLNQLLIPGVAILL